MFRLTNYEGNKPLYHYLSSIASRVIGNALEVWAGTPDKIRGVYLRCLWDTLERDGDFFEGISLYLDSSIIRPDLNVSADKASAKGIDISMDGRIGMELTALKIGRMKEKMADPDNYYTFDLLEEYLFGLMLADYDPQDYTGEKDPYVITTKKDIKETARVLLETYEVGKELAEELEDESLETDYPAWLAHSVHRLDQMSLAASDAAGFDSMFFWDDDYSIFFEKSFVEGIRELTGGLGNLMGYGYENVTEIFTDIGIRAPLMLVGSEAAFDARASVYMEEHRKYLEEIDRVGRSGFQFPEDEILPFS